MGLTKVTVILQNLQKAKKSYQAEFLVDTGAIDSMAPASQLAQVGIAIEGQSVYELANGEEVKYDYGYARAQFMGDETIIKMIFGPEKCEPLLGVLALESVGIMVDPVNQSLKRLAALPLK